MTKSKTNKPAPKFNNATQAALSDSDRFTVDVREVSRTHVVFELARPSGKEHEMLSVTGEVKMNHAAFRSFYEDHVDSFRWQTEGMVLVAGLLDD